MKSCLKKFINVELKILVGVCNLTSVNVWTSIWFNDALFQIERASFVSQIARWCHFHFVLQSSNILSPQCPCSEIHSMALPLMVSEITNHQTHLVGFVPGLTASLTERGTRKSERPVNCSLCLADYSHQLGVCHHDPCPLHLYRKILSYSMSKTCSSLSKFSDLRQLCFFVK